MHLCLVHGKVNATNATIHWSWNHYCGKEGGTVTIVAGSGGVHGQNVSSCTVDGGTETLYCQLTVTTSGVLSLSSTTDLGYDDTFMYGNEVHSGCSTDEEAGFPTPNYGQCCFV